MPLAPATVAAFPLVLLIFSETQILLLTLIVPLFVIPPIVSVIVAVVTPPFTLTVATPIEPPFKFIVPTLTIPPLPARYPLKFILVVVPVAVVNAVLIFVIGLLTLKLPIFTLKDSILLTYCSASLYVTF